MPNNTSSNAPTSTRGQGAPSARELATGLSGRWAQPGEGALSDRERQLLAAHASEAAGAGALTDRERWLIGNAHRF
jgi:hypothetical protein